MTVGTFDGVHLGHKFILQEIARRAEAKGAPATLVTFWPHPKLVLHADEHLGVLSTIEEKIELLQGFDLDRLVILEFTRAFAETSSRDFVLNILYGKIGFSEIVIGHDHAFGKNREGDISTLEALGREMGFAVDDLPALKVEGEVVSSTRIRNWLREGRIKDANKLLGYNYFLTGRVVQGDGRGRQLKFPTANIEPISEHKLVPAQGVYAVYVDCDGERWPGMMNIGVRPTFGAKRPVIEVHIINFDKSIYGELIRIEFVDRIRNEIQFASADELVEQLNSDLEASRSILSLT